MRPVEAVLSRLHGVRPVGQNRWVALCPAHDDAHPSLAVHEAPEGKVLLRCWAGCPTGAVLAALGLRWTDLFPDAGRRRGKALTPAERKAAHRAQAVVELRRRLDAASEELHRRLCVYVRAIHLAVDGADLETLEALAGWVHELPWLEHLLDCLESRDVKTRLWAAREVRRWLLT